MNLENVSSLKKLLILRESIDMIANGIRPDMSVVDACYEDLCRDLADYEAVLDEIDPKDDVAPVNITSEAEKQFGESYNTLLYELQRLNERVKKNYICYITVDLKNSKKYNLRIWDDREGCFVRTYFSKFDLDMNLQDDMRYDFDKPKKDVSKIEKEISDNYSTPIKSLDKMTTEDYLRAEFGEEAVKKFKQNNTSKNDGKDKDSK